MRDEIPVTPEEEAAWAEMEQRQALAAQPVPAPVEQEPRWYAVDRHGIATLCCDEPDAIMEAAQGALAFPNNAPYRAVPLADVTGWIEQHHRDSTELRRLCAERDQARQTAEYWKAEHLAGNAAIKQLEEALQWVSATLQAACRMPEPIREAGQITLDGDTRTVSAILDLADAALDLEVRQ